LTLCPPACRYPVVLSSTFVSMLRLPLLLLAVLFAWPSLGQGLMQRKRPELIPLDGKARRIGWYLAPGATYTLARFKDREEEVFRNADTSFSAVYDPNGRFGLYLEGGLAWYVRDPVVVDYLDLGIAYKNLRGAENSTGLLQRGDSLASILGEGVFAERLLTVHFNANKFIQTRDYQFVQLSLGANLDYRLGASHTYTGFTLPGSQELPPDLWTQVHVKLGYGFKATGNLLVIPALETPVFSFMPTDQGMGQVQWFSSRYRPLILSVRFLWLRGRKGFDCPPPPRKPGEARSKKYKPDSYHP
jgi:hypothetical protein